MSAHRTASGGRIDRSKPLNFTFDGKAFTGYAGDTLASALIANGVHLVGRSFKYHRPRGILTAGSEEPNALVSVGASESRRTPNLRATQVELYEGLVAESQNRWPSLQFDVGEVNDGFGRFLPAGFYYKTFMWPAGAWHKLYEPVIRRAAGLGRAPEAPDTDAYAQRYAHCEVLVIGSGPAGLAAALAAADSGGRVILCDEQPEFGGSLLHEREATIDGKPAAEWAADAVAQLAARPNVTLLTRTTAFGYYPHNMVGLCERLTDHVATPDAKLPREKLWQVRAGEVVIAAGQIERPLVFPENDRPGVMMAEAARIFANRYGVKPGTRAVVFTACDSAYRAALDLKAAGVEIAAIADLRAAPSGEYVARARAEGIPVHTETAVVGTSGRLRVTGAKLGRIGWTSSENVPCDLVLMSAGFTPTISLFSQSRGKMAWDEASETYLPKTSVEGERSAGACRGVTKLADVLADGFAAGAAAAKTSSPSYPPSHLQEGSERRGFPPSPLRGGVGGGGGSGSDSDGDAARRLVEEFHSEPPPPLPSPQGGGDLKRRASEADANVSSGHDGKVRTFAVEAVDLGTGGFRGATPHGRKPSGVKAFVDFQNDVTAKDIKLATQEGFRSIEHVKRYTTSGMATDQGRLSNINALAIVAEATGRTVPEIGLTTFRPPYTPTSFGVLAGAARGAIFEPERKTAVHDWAAAQGAVFEDVGIWKRARYFPRAGEDMHVAVRRECAAVRSSVGIFDASTLGKIEVVGPDAAEFMNRMYTNAWTKLGVGKLRYGVMLREDGFVMDDGVVGRIGPNRFHVTTTTGGAPRVLNHMEDYLQTEFPDLRVWLTSTTEQWTVIAVQGPNARHVLEPLVEGIDLSKAAMPHMSVQLGRICGVPTRLFRVSFTGELGFEVNVPSGHGLAVWEQIFESGRAHGIVPYGTEAMHVLRAEKGYIIVGQETDGTAAPDDVNLGWAIGKAKPDFVGKRSLSRPAIEDPNRKQLVGLFTTDPAVVLEEGSQVVQSGQAPASAKVFTPEHALGHITSAYDSAALNRSIALAMIERGRARMGETLYVPNGASRIPVTIVDPVFYDKANERLDA